MWSSRGVPPWKMVSACRRGEHIAPAIPVVVAERVRQRGVHAAKPMYRPFDIAALATSRKGRDIGLEPEWLEELGT